MKSASTDLDCTESLYDQLIRDFCKDKRSGTPLHPTTIPTRALVGRILKQKDTNTFDPIPLKFCHPANTFESKDLGLTGKRKLRLNSDLTMELDKTLEDYERSVGGQDFVSCVKVWGTAYALCDVINETTWGVHVDQFTQKLNEFPEFPGSVKLIEFRLRQKWTSFMRDSSTKTKSVSLLEAVQNYQDPDRFALFSHNALFVDVDTRITPHNTGTGYGAWSPPGVRKHKRGTPYQPRSGQQFERPTDTPIENRFPENQQIPFQPGAGKGKGKGKKGAGKGKGKAVFFVATPGLHGSVEVFGFD
jgi:hypothetical protein